MRVGSLALCLLFSLLAGPALAASWPDLSTSPAKIGGGERDAAVVVGIEKYLLVPKVPGARANAGDWFTWLTRTRGVPLERVHLLRDTDAAREGILAAVAKAASQVREGGTLWFVFVGHGAPAKDQRDGVLVGVDANQSAASLYARSVAQKEVLAKAAEGKQAHTLMVIDACFSGRTGTGAALAKGLQPLLPVTERAAFKGATVLSAGKASEFAGPLPGVERPAFSYLVLGALRGWGDDDGDGAVTAKEALGYARRAMASVVRDRNQTPELHGEGGGVTLAAKAREAGPDLTAIVLGGREVVREAEVPVATDERDTPSTVMSPADRAWQDAILAGKSGDKRKHTAALERYLKRHKKADSERWRTVSALYQLGTLSTGKSATKRFKSAIEAYEASNLAGDPRAKYAAAGAAYAMVEARRTAAGEMKLRGDQKKLAKDLNRELTFLRTLQTDYGAVLNYKVPAWSVCAMRGMGALYLRLARSLEAVPPPKSLTVEQQDVYMQALADQVRPIEQKGREILERAQAYADEQGVDNDCARDVKNTLQMP